MTFFRERPELLLPFRQGDRQVMQAVYWAYVADVERIVRYGCWLAGKEQRVPGAEHSDVRDLVQETFARAFSAPSRLAYDGLRNYAPYLATIARNALVDWGRARGRILLVEELPLSAAEVPEESDGWDDPATMELVEAYLAGLSPEIRQVHEQRYVQGRSQEAAAEVLGISRQRLRTFEGHLQKGLAKVLRQQHLRAPRK